MYRLTVDNVEHYLVVMRHIFSQNLKIHMKYKLKGSTVDREASQKERAKNTPTYKDNDFLQGTSINDVIKNLYISVFRYSLHVYTRSILRTFSLICAQVKA